MTMGAPLPALMQPTVPVAAVQPEAVAAPVPLQSLMVTPAGSTHLPPALPSQVLHTLLLVTAPGVLQRPVISLPPIAATDAAGRAQPPAAPAGQHTQAAQDIEPLLDWFQELDDTEDLDWSVLD